MKILTHKFNKNISLYILTIILLSACSQLGVDEPSKIALNFPPSDGYLDLFLIDGKVVVTIDEERDGKFESYSKEGALEFTQFVFNDVTENNCTPNKRITYHFDNQILQNNRLQVWKWCIEGSRGIDYLLSYDWETHQVKKIIGPLPLGSEGASWNPAQTKAIGYLDSKFADKTLYWIYLDKYEALDLEIKDGNNSWNLKDDFPTFNAAETGKSGTTGRASWSADGKQIAFFASPNAIGKIGFDRFGVEYYLYLMNPETLEYEVVAENIYSPFKLIWSPESKYIAFLAKSGFLKQEGIWLYSTKTNTISKVSIGNYRNILWRSETEIVAIECEDTFVCNQVVQFDISSLLEK